MDAKNMTTHLLQISSKYGVDTTWNMADYAGNITAQVRHAFEPENMSRTWTIEHWQFVTASMLTAVTGTKMDTAKTFQVNTTVSSDVPHINTCNKEHFGQFLDMLLSNSLFPKLTFPTRLGETVVHWLTIYSVAYRTRVLHHSQALCVLEYRITSLHC